MTRLRCTGKLLLILIGCNMLLACDKNQVEQKSAAVSSPAAPAVAVETVVENAGERSVIAIPDAQQAETENAQFNVGNTQYLFDLSNHSAEELEALLKRAEELRDTHPDGYDELQIVLVLHGPDIDIFRQENYLQHKPLVDLAAKLDAFDIIDMKICETTMSNMGVDRSEVPAFIESVPYAPEELRRLRAEGYIKL